MNDFTSKWPGGEPDATTIFGALAQADADYIHVTEFEAWQPAFADGGSSLIALARRHAPGVPIIAKGGLHTLDRGGRGRRPIADTKEHELAFSPEA